MVSAKPGPSAGLPKYLRLEREELLVWPEQIQPVHPGACPEQEPRRSGGADHHEHGYPRGDGAPAEPVSGPGGHDEEEPRRSLGLPDLQSPELLGLVLYVRRPHASDV